MVGAKRGRRESRRGGHMMNRAGLLIALAGTMGTGAPGARAQAVGGSDEVRAIVAEMLAEAEARSSSLAGASAGYDAGQFYMASDNGDFRLSISGFLQFRYD